jgi:hypothetical protein
VWTALVYLFLVGHSPEHWSGDSRLPQRKLTPHQLRAPPLQHNLTAEHTAFLADKISDWSASGVLVEAAEEVSTTMASPVFVIDKLLPKPGQEEVFADWLLSQPMPALRAWAEGGGFPTCPPCARVKRRPIFDLRQANAEHRVQLRMRFKSTTEACARLGPGKQLAAIDYTEGYTSVSIQPDGHSLVSRMLGKHWRHQSLPFGYWAAPALFCFISGEVAAQARKLHLSPDDYTQTYIDDTLVILAGTSDEVNKKFDAITTYMQFVGFRIHPGKLQRPAQSVEYLGVTLSIDESAPRLQLPAHKSAGLGVMLDLAVAHHTWPSKFWDRLLGKLQAALPLLPCSGPHIGSLRAACYAARFKASKSNILTPVGGREALQWLRTAVSENNGTHRTSWEPTRILGTGWFFTDASGEGGLGGAGLCSRRSILHAFAFSDRTPASAAFAENKYSTLLELMAVKKAVKLAAGTWAVDRASTSLEGGRYVLQITTDSQAAVALWRKGYSNRSGPTNQVIASIIHACDSHGIILSLTWVPRGDNLVADALSHPNPAAAREVGRTLHARATSVHALPDLLRDIAPSVCR